MNIDFIQLLENLVMKYYPWLSFQSVMRLKDLITWLSGMIFGVLEATLVISFLYGDKRIRRKEISGAKIVQVNTGTKCEIYVKETKSMRDAADVTIGLLLFRLIRGRNIYIEDVRRARIIVRILIALALIVAFIGLEFLLDQRL